MVIGIRRLCPKQQHPSPPLPKHSMLTRRIMTWVCEISSLRAASIRSLSDTPTLNNGGTGVIQNQIETANPKMFDLRTFVLQQSSHTGLASSVQGMNRLPEGSPQPLLAGPQRGCPIPPRGDRPEKQIDLLIAWRAPSPRRVMTFVIKKKNLNRFVCSPLHAVVLCVCAHAPSCKLCTRSIALQNLTNQLIGTKLTTNQTTEPNSSTNLLYFNKEN